MNSALRTILDEALAGATRATAREIGRRVTDGFDRANTAIENVRFPLHVAQAGLDALQAHLHAYASLASDSLKDHTSRPPR